VEINIWQHLKGLNDHAVHASDLIFETLKIMIFILGISIKKTDGGRKWPFCPRGSNRPVWGLLKILVFNLWVKTAIFCRGAQEKFPRGVKFSEKCLRGVKLSK